MFCFKIISDKTKDESSHKANYELHSVIIMDTQ